MNMIDLIYVKCSSNSIVLLNILSFLVNHVARALLETRCHFRPPSVQAESRCVHHSTRISPGATIPSPLKSNSPEILVQLNKSPFET
ncbi:hypothetical protein N7463_006468 [Penicillium fimorum]|uniref:Uncharacterized protein n=1 Tax=Penicillium fimorum TaxID=1882269 RepID=A0A9W9XUT3_9EURO|nr:hypothetical protein N7463_006468 [Penicillium fimorum]